MRTLQTRFFFLTGLFCAAVFFFPEATQSLLAQEAGVAEGENSQAPTILRMLFGGNILGIAIVLLIPKS